ncbi:MAG: HIT family protein [Erysipelotrichaceae bacterium]|nr:HIT family protein [Erysipelotrichaceae bacterium]
MCIFCKIIKQEIPAHVIYEDDLVLAIFDISQVTKGHTLIMPKKHYANIYEADDAVLERMIIVSRQLAGRLKKKFNASGINILNNNEPAAGQTVEHLHFHIIPRYDENDSIICEFRPSGINVGQVAAEWK